MPWARLDDRYDDHPDIELALEREPVAIAIHVMAITYCCRHNNSGRIPSRRIDLWLSRTPLRSKQKQSVLNTLFELKLFEWVDDHTLYVCNFLKWNLSREQRKELAEQGRRGGQSPKRPNPSGNEVSEGSSELGSDGLSDGLSGTSSKPLHASPRLAKSSSSRAARADDGKVTQEDRRLCGLLRQKAEEHNPKFKVKSPSRWLTDMRGLRELDNNSGDEIDQAICWVFSPASRGSGDFWWADVVASPGKLRKHFPQIWRQMSRGQVVPLNGERRERQARRLAAMERLTQQGGAA